MSLYRQDLEHSSIRETSEGKCPFEEQSSHTRGHISHLTKSLSDFLPFKNLSKELQDYDDQINSVSQQMEHQHLQILKNQRKFVRLMQKKERYYRDQIVRLNERVIQYELDQTREKCKECVKSEKKVTVWEGKLKELTSVLKHALMQQKLMKYLLGSLVGVLKELSQENTNRIEVIEQRKAEILNKTTESGQVRDTFNILTDCFDTLKDIVVPREVDLSTKIPQLLVSPSKTWSLSRRHEKSKKKGKSVKTQTDFLEKKPWTRQNYWHVKSLELLKEKKELIQEKAKLYEQLRSTQEFNDQLKQLAKIPIYSQFESQPLMTSRLPLSCSLQNANFLRRNSNLSPPQNSENFNELDQDYTPSPRYETPTNEEYYTC